MKKLLCLLTCILGLVACGDLEGSGNGDFDGMWQLAQVDSIDKNISIDVRERQIYWCVQGNMLDMRDHLLENGDGHSPLLFRFEFVSDTLHVTNPFLNYRREQDPSPTSPKATEFYGLNGLEEAFLVRQLSASKMVLETCRQHNNVRMNFRKY